MKHASYHLDIDIITAAIDTFSSLSISLTPTQRRILLFLYKNKQASHAELCRAIADIDPSTISHSIAELETIGFALRKRSRHSFYIISADGDHFVRLLLSSFRHRLNSASA